MALVVLSTWCVIKVVYLAKKEANVGFIIPNDMQYLPLHAQLPMCAATLLLHHGHPGRDQHKMEHHIKTSCSKSKKQNSF